MEALADALRLLAAPADLQRSALPVWVAMPEEVALVFQDAVALVDKRDFSAEEWHAIQEVRKRVDDLWKEDDPREWSDSALVDSESWEELRQLAHMAIDRLSIASGQPAFHGVRYIAARSPTSR